MQCDICGQKGAKIRRVTRSYGKGNDLLIIENIPMISCPNCGESYLTASTLHEIDRIKKHRQALASKRAVEVASFVFKSCRSIFFLKTKGRSRILAVH